MAMAWVLHTPGMELVHHLNLILNEEYVELDEGSGVEAATAHRILQICRYPKSLRMATILWRLVPTKM